MGRLADYNLGLESPSPSSTEAGKVHVVCPLKSKSCSRCFRGKRHHHPSALSKQEPGLGTDTSDLPPAPEPQSPLAASDRPRSGNVSIETCEETRSHNEDRIINPSQPAQNSVDQGASWKNKRALS
ncbi:hypothetical protein DPEC_G00228350 [Dallia pectoralis]|uniref:Uncharacterized protein n=1 Tax=Dallia pectoralis TaxID=75939 RepID=A0ACC2G199_DALPE|nr:hypothetical protein DPEC_G00228350 [Dallia pectoralis]